MNGWKTGGDLDWPFQHFMSFKKQTSRIWIVKHFCKIAVFPDLLSFHQIPVHFDFYKMFTIPTRIEAQKNSISFLFSDSMTGLFGVCCVIGQLPWLRYRPIIWSCGQGLHHWYESIQLILIRAAILARAQPKPHILVLSKWQKRNRYSFKLKTYCLYQIALLCTPFLKENQSS